MSNVFCTVRQNSILPVLVTSATLSIVQVSSFTGSLVYFLAADARHAACCVSAFCVSACCVLVTACRVGARVLRVAKSRVGFRGRVLSWVSAC